MIKLLGSIIGVALVGAGFVFNAHEAVTPVAGYEIGDLASDFTLKNIDGNMESDTVIWVAACCVDTLAWFGSFLSLLLVRPKL